MLCDGNDARYNFVRSDQRPWSLPSVDKWILRIIVVHLNSLLDNRELLEIMLHVIRLYEGVQVSKTSLSVPLTIVARICVLYARWSLWNIVDTNGSKSKWFNHLSIVSIVILRLSKGSVWVYNFWVNFNFSIRRVREENIFRWMFIEMKGVSKVYNWVLQFWCLRDV